MAEQLYYLDDEGMKYLVGKTKSYHEENDKTGEEAVSALSATVTDLQTTVTDLQSAVSSVQTTVSSVQSALAQKQDTLTPGDGISIDGGTIASTCVTKSEVTDMLNSLWEKVQEAIAAASAGSGTED